MTRARRTLGGLSALALLAAAPLAGVVAVASTPAFAAAAEGKETVNPLNLRQGVGIKGYDPVAYFTDGKPVEGDPAITATYQGATYRFASAQHKAMFQADPAHYAPQYGGYCAFAISQDLIADVSPKSWAVRNDKLYLNNNAFAHGLWKRDNEGHIAKGDTNWKSYPKSADVPFKYSKGSGDKAATF